MCDWLMCRSLVGPQYTWPSLDWLVIEADVFLWIWQRWPPVCVGDMDRLVITLIESELIEL